MEASKRLIFLILACSSPGGASSSSSPATNPFPANSIDLSPDWSFVDGNGCLELNKNTSLDTAFSVLVPTGTNFYTLWLKNNSSANPQFWSSVGIVGSSDSI